MPEKVLILAGGGGHTGYAHTLAQELEGRLELSFLVPDDDPLSWKRLKSFGKVQTLVKPRHPRTPIHEFLPRLLLSFLLSMKKVDKGYKAVISTGSNFCIPPSLVSWLRRMPVINVESADLFVKPSKTARILQPIAAVTVLHWKDQRRILRGKVFGPLLPRKEVEPWSGEYVLIAAGTYGYRDLLEAVSRSQIDDVILQTGSSRTEMYERKHPKWKVISTTDRFYELVAGAEVVITPPGVTALEAVSYGKPLIIVKYPKWSRAGTLEDARLFAEKINAPFVSDLSRDVLLSSLKRAKEMERPRFKNGAKNLAEFIVRL